MGAQIQHSTSRPVDAVHAGHGDFLYDTQNNVKQSAVWDHSRRPRDKTEISLILAPHPYPHFILLLSVFGLYENNSRQLGFLMLKEGEADYESGLWNPRHLFWDSLLGHSVFPKLVESFVRDSLGVWQSREKSAQLLPSVLWQLGQSCAILVS